MIYRNPDFEQKELTVLPQDRVIDPAAAFHRYADSNLIVQLLAIRDRHPQWQEHRRAAPLQAVAAYQAALQL